MSNDKPRNPSAFPTGYTSGMTLRDYFAAKAMVALIAKTGGDGEYYAATAYALADAMLAEREREE